jgi:DNA primase
VATCGTAITAEHVDALGTAAEGIVLALDGDRAGRDAALRAWPLVSTLAASVVILPDGQDPATLFQRHGADALRQALLRCQPLADVVIDDRIRRAGGPLKFLQQRLDAATAAATVLVVLPADQISERVATLAQRLDLPPELITSALLNAVSPAADDFPFGPLHGSTDADTAAESRTPSNQTRHRRTR